MLSSPESGQYLCAPAFPGLSDAKPGIKEEKRFVVNYNSLVSVICSVKIWSAAVPTPFRSWSCGFSLSFSKTASDFLRTCTLWWKWPEGKCWNISTEVMTLKPFKKEFIRNGIPYPGSVLLDISPVLVKLNNIQMLQLDEVVKNSFDFFLLIGNKKQTGQSFKTKLSKAVLLISA